MTSFSISMIPYIMFFCAAFSLIFVYLYAVLLLRKIHTMPTVMLKELKDTIDSELANRRKGSGE